MYELFAGSPIEQPLVAWLFGCSFFFLFFIFGGSDLIFDLLYLFADLIVTFGLDGRFECALGELSSLLLDPILLLFDFILPFAI